MVNDNDKAMHSDSTDPRPRETVSPLDESLPKQTPSLEGQKTLPFEATSPILHDQRESN